MPDSIYPIIITATEAHGVNRQTIPHRMGIPFPKGVLRDANNLQLLDLTQQSMPFQHKALSHWPDNSIRWLLIDFKISTQKNTHTIYQLLPVDISVPTVQSIYLKQLQNHVHIDNSAISFDINRDQFLGLSNINIGGQPHPMQQTDFYLTDDKGRKFQAYVDNMELPTRADGMRSEIRINGHFGRKNNHRFFRFESNLSVFANSPIIELDITLHNPRAAQHKGGFWDLGDPGSLFFRSLILELNFNNIKQVKIKDIEKDNSRVVKNNFRIYQDSSGGENWNHHIHIDKNGDRTVSFKGYQISENDKIIDRGNRTNPIITIHDKEGPAASFHIQKFWQNFPKAFSTDRNKLKIELFPETLKSSHELQGGEQKTHTVRLSLNSHSHPLQAVVAPLNVTLPLHHYHLTDAIPGLPPEPTYTALDEIIDEGIKGENSFFIKREAADEYGWRHFGDLWADHETLEHGNDKSIVSHYNNQYDPIYGFYKQFINTGDHRWFELMEDLAQHVIDIDIYHTDEDRPEYNHGLFWHTDHYLDGTLCTHRSFSKLHMKSEHVEQSGGGPGSEHCYTTGLLYYYFMTGNLQHKRCVNSLISWSEHSNEKSQTVLDRLYRFLLNDIKTLIRITRGHHVYNYRYPLTRGTANYINSLLDSYILYNDPAILSNIGNIIRNTLSPEDKITERNLVTDIESNWHYTVLLQSITRFVYVKYQAVIYDDDLDYSIQCLKHYLDWVNVYERPYLENKDLLVYPNLTWVAQDLRKAYLLFIYAHLSDCSLQRSEYYLDHIISNLQIVSDRNTTRILTLLMQNNFYWKTNNNLMSPLNQEIYNYKESALPVQNNNSIFRILKSFGYDIYRRLKTFSIKNEISWIKFKIF